MNITLKASKPGSKDFDYSSVHVVLPKDLADKVLAWGQQHVTDDMLCKDKEGGAREDYPHCTVKYGLPGDEPTEVQELLADEPKATFKLGKISLFKSEDESPDVLKVEVISPDLHRLNRKISDNIKCTDTFPTYKPHITIAYVEKGKADSLEGNTELEGLKGVVDQLEFSSRKKEKGATELHLVATFTKVEGHSGEHEGQETYNMENGSTQKLPGYYLHLRTPEEKNLKVYIAPMGVTVGGKWLIPDPVTYRLTLVTYQDKTILNQLWPTLEALGYTHGKGSDRATNFSDKLFSTYEQAKTQGVAELLQVIDSLQKTAAYSAEKESERGEMFTDEDEQTYLYTSTSGDVQRLPTYRLCLSDDSRYQRATPSVQDIDILVSPDVNGTGRLTLPVGYNVHISFPTELLQLHKLLSNLGFIDIGPWMKLPVQSLEAGKTIVHQILNGWALEDKTAAFTPSLVNAPTNRGHDSDSDVLIPTKLEFTDSEDTWHFPYVKRNVDWDMVLPTVLEVKAALKSNLEQLSRPPRSLEDLLVWFKRYTDHSDRAIADMSESQAYTIALRLWGTWKTQDVKANLLTPRELEAGPKELALGLGLAVLPTPTEAKPPAKIHQPKPSIVAPHKKEHPKKHKHPVGWNHYEHLVGLAADQFKIPPQMLHRLLRAENPWGDPNAMSEAGAIGLAQFMPGTASELGIDPKDPKASIEGAAKYLGKLYDQFGNWVDAVRAYNWGPGHVRKHQQHPENDPPETKRYVNKILPKQSGKQPNTTWETDEPFSPLPTMLPLATNDDNLTQQYSRNYKGLKDSPYWDNLDLMFDFLAERGQDTNQTFQVASQGSNFLILHESSQASSLGKTAQTYSDREMEQINTKRNEDSGDHYSDNSGGGHTIHTWNDDSNDYPQPKDMQKGTPLDQLVPVDRRFQQHVTPPTSSPVDFIKEPTSDGDMGDYDYSKWKKSYQLTPLELAAANLIDLSRVQVLEINEDFTQVKGSANFLGKAVLWSAKLVPSLGKIKVYKIDTSEIEKTINRAKLTAPVRREQLDLVVEKIRELLYSPKILTHRNVPSTSEIDQLWDSLPKVWWSKQIPSTTTLTLDYVKDLLRRHKFDANYFSVLPSGRSLKYSWTLAGNSLLVIKY